MKIDVNRSGGQAQGGLDQSGGSLSGPLMLSRNPQLPLEAATKAYIDAELQTLNASNFTTGTLPIARLPIFSGDVSNEAGSNTINLSDTGVTAGEYGKIVVNEKGRVTNGTVLAGSDIPNIGFNKIISDKPVTLEGYGITDGISVSGAVMTGALNLSGNPTTSENLVTKQYVDGMVNNLSGAKTGDIIRKSYSSTPDGFLRCNGGLVDKTTYANLYAVIGESNNSYNVIGSGKPWQQQYQINSLQSVDIGGWTASTALPGVLTGSQVIVTKNRVYLIGGYNNVTYVSTVYTALINADGTLGAWGSGTSLPSVLSYTSAIVLKNRVYLLGGFNGSVSVNTVYTAVINANGTLGAWTTGTSLPGALGFSSVIVTNSRVYLLGGINSTTISTVYVSTIASDGMLNNWVTDTSLPNVLSSSHIAVTKNRVYLLGGYNGTAYLSSVYTAPINADGTLGAWGSGTSLPTTVGNSQVIVTKSRVYLLGGIINGTFATTVYTAPINTDGTLGTWTTGTSITAAIAIPQAIITSSRVYLLGGHLTGAVAQSTVYTTSFSGGLNDYSAYFTEDTTNYMVPGSGKPWQQQYQINTTQSGDITGWTTGTSIPGVFMGTQAIVTKNRVYLLGGGNGSAVTSTVYTAPINADGTLGTWITTTSLPGILSNTQAIVTKNRVYVLGGLTAANTPTSVVYTATINADGTLGSWATGTSLPGVLSHSQAVVTKNRVYLIGGHNGAGALTTVYTASINSDGTLGTWSTGASLPTALHGCSAIITKNRIYVIGGASSATAQSTIYSATINSDGLFGSWNTEPSFPVNNYNASIYTSKNIVYIIGGSATNSTTVTANVYRSTINSDGTLGPWVLGTSLPSGFCQSSLIVVNNRIYTLGGYNGASVLSTVYTAIISEGLNDYSVYYDGSITPLEPVNPSTLFKLPDMSATDVNGLYHYIKY